MVFRNCGTLPQNYTSSQRKDEGSTIPRKVGILPQYYTVSQHSRSRRGSLSSWETQISQWL